MKGSYQVAQRKGSNGPTLEGQMELLFGDLENGCADLSVALHLLRKVTSKVETAYLHGSRGFRRGEIVMDGIRDMRAGWDGVERRANWRPEAVPA